MARKPRLSKILAREPKKSWIFEFSCQNQILAESTPKHPNRQFSSGINVKMFDFIIFSDFTNQSTLRWKKSCPSFLHRVPETEIQQKLHSPNSSFLKKAIDVSFTSSCVQMMTQITESEKKPTSRTF